MGVSPRLRMGMATRKRMVSFLYASYGKCPGRLRGSACTHRRRNNSRGQPRPVSSQCGPRRQDNDPQQLGWTGRTARRDQQSSQGFAAGAAARRSGSAHPSGSGRDVSAWPGRNGPDCDFRQPSCCRNSFDDVTPSHGRQFASNEFASSVNAPQFSAAFGTRSASIIEAGCKKSAPVCAGAFSFSFS
jgi:hypothetical protein